ncbi:MAG: OsmC family protein [Planctomycetes bacterium]|nr:OsmC family protein [Planctomycetota bacterium]
MVKIQIRYAGDLRCHATHGPSSVTLSTDAPVDNQGRGESFSPTDLVATALGSCMLTIMGIVARRHGWDLSGAGVEVEKSMVATGVRRIGSLGVVIRVPANLDAAARAALENAAHTCPVHKSLHPDIQIPVRFLFGAAAHATDTV